MAMTLNAIAFQSPKRPSFALPPLPTTHRSPTLCMASSLRSASKHVRYQIASSVVRRIFKTSFS